MIFLDHRFSIPNFPSRLLSYMQARVPVLAVTDPNTDIGDVITGRVGAYDQGFHPGTNHSTQNSDPIDDVPESGYKYSVDALDHPAFGWWEESNDVKAVTKLIRRICGMSKGDLVSMGDAGYDYMIENYDVRRSYETIMKEMKGIQ